jgi:hypothetical protein
MVLQDKLRSIQMLKTESVTSYLGRFTQIRDELAVVGEIVDPEFMVRTNLNNFSKPWGSFVQGIVSREVMPTWERLWDDFVQEELRCNSGSSGQQQYLRVMRIFLFGQRERRRSTRVHDKVPRWGPSHSERVAVGRRGI